MRSFLTSTLLACVAVAPALAKLPPLGEEAKAKAAETSARAAWSDKVGTYKLCVTMDRVAEQYRKSAEAAGKTPGATVATASCNDPGPFVATPVTPTVDKPLEVSGAHSPAGTAVSPPSVNAPAAALDKAKK